MYIKSKKLKKIKDNDHNLEADELSTGSMLSVTHFDSTDNQT